MNSRHAGRNQRFDGEQENTGAIKVNVVQKKPSPEHLGAFDPISFLIDPETSAEGRTASAPQPSSRSLVV